MSVHVEVVKRFTLKATIDGHLPLGATFRVTGGDQPFRITFITVNWGRGYAPGEFHDNVMNVLDFSNEKHYVVLLIQELDEADAAPERKIFMAEMEPGTTLIPEPPVPGRETVAVSPGIKVTRKRRTMTMDQGTKIGAPVGTGPRRFFVSCIIHIHGVKIGVGNQHPHRIPTQASKSGQDVVRRARQKGEAITHQVVSELVADCDLTVYGGDMNDAHYPRMNSREKTANERNLDTLRYVVS